MLKSRISLCTLAVLAGVVSSCILDPDPGKPPVEPPPPQKIEDLTERWHVLNNFEYAYNNRNIDVYDGLLDQGFTFFLTTGDVGDGLPAQWDRQEEMRLNGPLLDKNYTGPNACQDTFLDIRAEDGVQWSLIIRPTESWYTTILYYDFRFEIAPTTYIPLPGAQAQFTVRNDGTEEAPHWQLVEFRDLAGP